MDLSGSVSTGAGSDASVLRDLTSYGTLVRLAPDGAFSELHFEAPEGSLSSHVVRGILALRMLRRPLVLTPSATWSTTNEDVYGAYLATGHVTELNRSSVVLRVERAPTPITSGKAPSAGRVRYAPGDGARFELDRASGGVQSLDVTIHARSMLLGRAVASTDATLRLQAANGTAGALSWDPDARWRDWELRRLAAGSASDLAATEASAALRARMDRDALGADTWASLQTAVRASSPTSETFLKLRSLFRIRPKSVSEALRSFRQTPIEVDESFLLVARALVSADTPEAQAALGEGARDEALSQARRTILVASLGQVHSPSPSVDAALIALASQTSDVADTAWLAIGNVAHAVADTSPERFARLMNRLSEALLAARTPEARVTALLALGNAGSPRALEAARNHLGDPDTRVRIAAAGALRFVGSREAESLLTHLACTDSAVEVRGEAIAALGFRTPEESTLRSLAERLSGEPMADVRIALIRVLGDLTAEAPWLYDVLREIQRRDAHAEVRRAAQVVLDRPEG
jgi:HEAT repeat protein